MADPTSAPPQPCFFQGRPFAAAVTAAEKEVATLKAAIAEDRAAGRKPVMIIGNAGTTNTGAVDPMVEVADLCATEGLWHHVDGAYGAFFHLCPELRLLLVGLDRAGSLTLDPHKGLFLPYGTGALLVRDALSFGGQCLLAGCCSGDLALPRIQRRLLERIHLDFVLAGAKLGEQPKARTRPMRFLEHGFVRL